MSVNVTSRMNVFTQPIHHGQDVIQSKFSSGVNLTFPSPRLVALQSLKNSACPSIGEEMGVMHFLKALARREM